MSRPLRPTPRRTPAFQCVPREGDSPLEAKLRLFRQHHFPLSRYTKQSILLGAIAIGSLTAIVLIQWGLG